MTGRPGPNEAVLHTACPTCRHGATVTLWLEHVEHVDGDMIATLRVTGHVVEVEHDSTEAAAACGRPL